MGLGLSANAAFAPAAMAQSQKAQKTAINAISAMQVVEEDAGTIVRIKGSAVPTFSVYKLTSPLRLLIDVSNSELSGEPQTDKVNNGVISQVALLEFSDSVQSITRVIVGFDQAAHYDVRTEGNDVVVFVDGAARQKSTGNVAAVQKELDESRVRLEATRARLGELETSYQGRLTDSHKRVEVAEGELDATRQRLVDAERELASMRKRLDGASADERGKVQSEVNRQRDSIRDLKTDLASQSKSVESLRASNDKLRTERDAERARVAELAKKAEAALARAEKIQGERDNALAEARTKEKEQRAAQARVKDLEARLGSTQTDLARADQAAKSSQATVDAKSRELASAQKRQADLERQIAALRNTSGSDAKSKEALASLESERGQLAKSLDARQRELDKAREQARQADQAVAGLKSMVQTKDAEIARLEREIRDARGDAKSANSARVAALTAAVEQEKQRVAALEEARKADERQLSALKKSQSDERSKRQDGEAKLASIQQELARAKNNKAPAVRAVAVSDNEVRGIRLETADGRSRIVVQLDRPGTFETLAGSDGQAVMVLDGVNLPKSLERTLSATDGGAVRFVSTFRDDQGRVRLEAELGGSVTEVVRQQGDTLVWEFAPSAHQQLAWNDPQAQTRPSEGDAYTAAPPGYPRVVSDPTQVSSVPGMSRKRMTIDLREADIQNVLRLLAKEGGVNIVSGAGVSGTVTLRLRSVPLDEVFLTVLQSRGLGFEKRGNVIRVAPQDTLRKEEQARAEERAANARQKPLEVFLLPINYAAAGELSPQVEGLLSPRGTVTVDERTNTLIIKDIAENLSAIRALVGNLDSEVPQVLIEARIVETNDTFQQQFGIQWGGDLTFSQANGNPTGLIFPNVLGLAGGATDGQTPTAGTDSSPNFAVNLPAPAGTGAGGALGLTLGSIGGALNINLRLSALEAAGHAKIVSSPKILTLDNKSATISQGTSIPISVVSAAGVQTVFVDATLELSVTPHVTPDGNVQLSITANKNEPDFQNTGSRGDPTIIRKQAETELLIRDGDTTVIGGIYTRNSGSAYSAVPFLHKIPILGYFFRTTTESDRRTELLIFITPKIVNRARSLAGPATGGAE
jgi:type IV pilus assembly protein PilQ